ncbi:hypothetical protein NW754_001450 [Fusarium falciforme]|nr:hypothetical protein NW754_001450 [Fusarium falciforme]
MSTLTPAEILSNKRRDQLPDVWHLSESKISHSDFQKGTSSQWSGRGGYKLKALDVQTGTASKASPSLPSLFGNLSDQMINQVRECLRVWICSRFALDRDGFPLYVELAFPDDKGQNPQVLRKTLL